MALRHQTHSCGLTGSLRPRSRPCCRQSTPPEQAPGQSPFLQAAYAKRSEVEYWCDKYETAMTRYMEMQVQAVNGETFSRSMNLHEV